MNYRYEGLTPLPSFAEYETNSSVLYSPHTKMFRISIIERKTAGRSILDFH
jgi:hypothetical protein